MGFVDPATLEQVCAEAGYPGTIRVDQGAELISRDLDLWKYVHGVTLDFSRPGKPTDNAFIEAFNSKLRAKCLNAHWLMSLEDAREKLEDGRMYYNGDRPIAESAKCSRFCCKTLVAHPVRHRRSKPKTPASGDPTLGHGATPAFQSMTISEVRHASAT